MSPGRETGTETSGPKGSARSPKGGRDRSSGHPPKGAASAPKGAIGSGLRAGTEWKDALPDGLGWTVRHERSKGRSYRRDLPLEAETAGPGTPRGGASFLGVSRVLGRARQSATLAAMAWPEDSLSEGENIVTEFRQHWKLLIVPIAWFVLALVVIGLIEWVLPDGDAWDWVQWILMLAVIGAAIWFVLRPIVSWLTTLYVLTNERLITRRGLIAKSGIEIPLENITNVNFSQTAIERMLGTGDLLVESAGTTGQSEFHNIPRPDNFAALLYKVREERSVSIQGGTVVQAPDADPTEQLQRLKQLHNDGILTDEEYQAKRQKLVDEI